MNVIVREHINVTNVNLILEDRSTKNMVTEIWKLWCDLFNLVINAIIAILQSCNKLRYFINNWRFIFRISNAEICEKCVIFIHIFPKINMYNVSANVLFNSILYCQNNFLMPTAIVLKVIYLDLRAVKWLSG